MHLNWLTGHVSHLRNKTRRDKSHPNSQTLCQSCVISHSSAPRQPLPRPRSSYPSSIHHPLISCMMTRADLIALSSMRPSMSSNTHIQHTKIVYVYLISIKYRTNTTWQPCELSPPRTQLIHRPLYKIRKPRAEAHPLFSLHNLSRNRPRKIAFPKYVRNPDNWWQLGALQRKQPLPARSSPTAKTLPFHVKQKPDLQCHRPAHLQYHSHSSTACPPSGLDCMSTYAA